MKSGNQINSYRAVIRICLHDISHIIPPFTVNGRVSALAPQLRIFNFDITKQSQGLSIQKNGVVFTSVAVDHVNHFWPQQIVPADILLFLSWKQLHFESLNHFYLLNSFLYFPYRKSGVATLSMSSNS